MDQAASLGLWLFSMSTGGWYLRCSRFQNTTDRRKIMRRILHALATVCALAAIGLAAACGSPVETQCFINPRDTVPGVADTVMLGPDSMIVTRRDTVFISWERIPCWEAQ